MITIKYYDGKKRLEIEVTNEVAEAHKELFRYEDKINKREKRHRATSLEKIEDEYGFQLVDLSIPDILDMFIDEETKKEELVLLKSGLKTLTAKQKELVYLRFVKNWKIKDIAAHCETTMQSIQNRLNKIISKLKKYF